MKAENVFVDTQVFDQMMNDFESTPLKVLGQLGQKGRIVILLSSVIYKEVESHIKANTHEALASLNQFQRKARPFKSLGKQYEPFFEPYDNSAAADMAVAVWKKYLSDSKAKVIEPSSINVQKILDSYFAGTPPFGENKKKSEFPDAISLATLLLYLEDNNETAYVISKDGDLARWCSENSTRVTYVDTLAAFLDSYNRENQPQLSQAALEKINRHKRSISAKLRKAFEVMSFSYEPSYVADVELKAVRRFDLDAFEVVDVDVSKAIISASVYAEFEYHVSGPDYSDAIWDNEDKEYIYIGSFSEDVEQEDHYEVSFTIEFPEHTDTLGEITGIEFNGSSDSISVGEDDFPYK